MEKVIFVICHAELLTNSALTFTFTDVSAWPFSVVKWASHISIKTSESCERRKIKSMYTYTIYYIYYISSATKCVLLHAYYESIRCCFYILCQSSVFSLTINHIFAYLTICYYYFHFSSFKVKSLETKSHLRLNAHQQYTVIYLQYDKKFSFHNNEKRVLKIHVLLKIIIAIS